MDFNITIDFRGNKNIDIDTTGKENYKLTVLLTVCGGGAKLAPLIILKSEPGKSITKNKIIGRKAERQKNGGSEEKSTIGVKIADWRNGGIRRKSAAIYKIINL